MLEGGDDMEMSREESAKDILEVALERSAQHPLKLWTTYYASYSRRSFISTTKLREVRSRIEQIYLRGTYDPFHMLNSSNLGFQLRRIFDPSSFTIPTRRNLNFGPALAIDIINGISTLSRFPNIVSSGLVPIFRSHGSLRLRPLRGLAHLSVDIRCSNGQCAVAASGLADFDELKAYNCFGNFFSSLTLPALKRQR
ncbi:hypothetical protein C8J56DRAFT_1059450 [Mycena floridula]|nr:hypothetical protein C8J56DRAFT_1059450 [Mycena floridula]